MRKISRRHLLKYSILPTIAGVFAPFLQRKTDDRALAGANLAKEIHQVRLAWFESNRTQPVDFLFPNGDSVFGSLRDFETERRADFESGNTIIVKGLVLSRTEAALLLVVHDGASSKLV